MAIADFYFVGNAGEQMPGDTAPLQDTMSEEGAGKFSLTLHFKGQSFKVHLCFFGSNIQCHLRLTDSGYFGNTAADGQPSNSDGNASNAADGNAGNGHLDLLCKKFAMACSTNSVTFMTFADKIQDKLMRNEKVCKIDALKYLLHAEIALNDEQLASLENYDCPTPSAGLDVYRDKLCVNEAGFQNILMHPLFQHYPKSVLPNHVGYLHIELPNKKQAEIMVVKDTVRFTSFQTLNELIKFQIAQK